MKARWWSQRFPPEGGPAGEGIARQLGKPRLDPLTILVREAAQNSWDARLGDGRPVEFTLHLKRLGNSATVWRRALLPGPHLDPEAGGMPLEQTLGPDCHVLVISDRGTRGLGGPLRADVRSPAGVVPNFVQFLRNVGEPRDKEHGGGTYGFGKGILYSLSSSGCILVDTSTVDDLGMPRRLMGSALGHSFYDGDVRHTGRHWWGMSEGDVADPVLGAAAADLAAELGLPGFDDGQTGTDIVIVGFDPGVVEGDGEESEARSPGGAAQYLASSILWHLWPKMGSESRPADMRFRVVHDGVEIPVPNPADEPRTRPFVLALDDLHVGKGTGYTRKVAPKHAGDLVVTQTVADPDSLGPAAAVVRDAMPIAGPLCHIVRMRTPELVVDYYAGPASPHPDLGYAGVFKATTEADVAFALSEPPTHDDWVDKGLSGTHLGVVRGSRTFLRNELSRLLDLDGAGVAIDASGLGRLSSALGAIIPTTPGLGPSPIDGGDAGQGGRGGGQSRIRKPRIVDGPQVVVFNGKAVVAAKVLVPGSKSPLVLDARTFVVIDGGGRESEAPAGGRSPEVIGWRAADGSDAGRGPSLGVPAGEDSEWYVYVTHVPDTAVGVEIEMVKG